MGLVGAVAKEVSREIGSKTREFYEFVLPPVDIHMSASEITVTVDMPGFAKDEMSINLDGSTLTIRASRERRMAGEAVSEQRPLVIDKKIRLPAPPEDISESVSSASCEDGVLTVTVAKVARGRDIPVS